LSRRQAANFSALLLCAGLVMIANTVQAATLDFNTALKRAIQQSYDLKIAQTDIGISQTGVTTARAEYYPTIQGRASIERQKGLQSQPGNVTTVGNTVLPSGTRFQSSIGLSLNHTLTDFGVRKRKLQIAKKDVLVKAHVYDQQLRDLKFSVVDAYAKALINYKSLKASEAVLTLTQEVFQMKKRLYQAKAIPKVDMAEEAITLAQGMDDIEVNKQKLSESLQALSALTREEYDPGELELLGFEDADLGSLPLFDEQLTPESKVFNLQIQQKQSEVEFLKRQYLPQVSLYSYYNFYGYDVDQLGKAIQNMGARTISVGLSVNMPIFDGFKNKAAVQKAELEKQKLTLQRDDKLADLKNQAKVLATQAQAYSVQLRTKATILNKTQDKMSMLQRLSDQQMIEKSQTVKEHIQRIQRQVQVENSIIQGVAAQKKLQLLSMAQP
jgi:outer membrane protein